MRRKRSHTVKRRDQKNPNPHFKEYTFAWLPKARDCSLRDHPWHPAVWRGPWSPRMLIASAFGPASRKRVLAGDQVARQPTAAPSIRHSDFPRTGEWLLRIGQCLRCKDRLGQPECSSRAARKRWAPSFLEVLTSEPGSQIAQPGAINGPAIIAQI